MSRSLRIFFKLLLPLAVIVIAALITKTMIENRPQPQREEARIIEIPVKVAVVGPSTEQVLIEAGGTVMAAREINLQPQVSGEVIALHPALEPGGFINADEVVIRIEPRDYELAVKRQEAELARARFNVAEETGRQSIAQREWDLLGSDMESSEEGRDLALRKPHLRRAKAELASAESGLAQAKLDLERTSLIAPFNAKVINKRAEMGQIVNSQTPVATLIGTDRFWVQASVPFAELEMFNLPDRDGLSGAKVQVVQQAGEKPLVKNGYVFRLLGDMAESGRMARVLIVIDDPLGLSAENPTRPLLIGSYVRVEIFGKFLEDVYAIPSEAVREGDRLWVMNRENELEIRQTRILRRERERALVTTGLDDGDRLIVSRIGTPVPGMQLKQVNLIEQNEVAYE